MAPPSPSLLHTHTQFLLHFTHIRTHIEIALNYEETLLPQVKELEIVRKSVPSPCKPALRVYKTSRHVKEPGKFLEKPIPARSKSRSTGFCVFVKYVQCLVSVSCGFVILDTHRPNRTPIRQVIIAKLAFIAPLQHCITTHKNRILKKL